MISQTNFYNSFFCIHMIQSFIVSELAEQKIFDISEYFKNGMILYLLIVLLKFNLTVLAMTLHNVI